MKTLSERWKEEPLGDNTSTFSQCKSCRFRDKVYVTWENTEEEYGWKKVYCRYYGRDTAVRSNLLIPYLPRLPENKPNGILDNTTVCDFRKEETRSVEETRNNMNALAKHYKEEYKKLYSSQELDDGIPVVKNATKEAIVYEKTCSALPNIEA